MIKITGGGGGNSADTCSRTGPADSRCRVVVHLDDRPAGDDDLFFHASLQPSWPRLGEFCGAWKLSVFSDPPRLSDVAAKYPGAGGLGACDHDPFRHAA